MEYLLKPIPILKSKIRWGQYAALDKLEELLEKLIRIREAVM
jgi:hypothetical protein